MSGPTIPSHVVVAGTRRSWTREEKRAIVDEAENTTETVAAVARRHGLTPSLLFRWRREVWDEACAASLPAQPAFVPLALPPPPAAAACDPCRQDAATEAAIEIDLAGGHRLRAGAGVNLAVILHEGGQAVEALPHTALRPGRSHDGVVVALRSNVRWCSDHRELHSRMRRPRWPYCRRGSRTTTPFTRIQACASSAERVPRPE